MEAPNKIFMPDFEIEERAEFLVVECENDIPYIRKDAILEWAKEIAENASWVSIDAVVNKIESL